MKKVILGATLLLVAFPLSALAFGHSQRYNGHNNTHGQSSPKPVPTPVPPTPTPQPVPTPIVNGSESILTNVYTTGYANYDNTPRGSTEVDLGGHKGTTGGNGTYANPTTLAVGGSIINGKEVDDFAYGTIFYVPNLRKYFIATDFCGDGNSPQTQPCHDLTVPSDAAPKGTTLWVDLFVGGGSAKQDTCESDITPAGSSDLRTVIENPPSNLAVVAGDICSTNGVPQTQYGNSIVVQ